MKRILFACVGNSFRSQVAEAWARALAAGSRVEIRSGGTRPAGLVHPIVGPLMREVGIAVDGQTSKPLDLAFAQAADAFVTLCGPLDDACPARIARKAIDWDLPDPSEASEEEQRRVRDLIGQRVKALLAEHGLLGEGVAAA